MASSSSSSHTAICFDFPLEISSSSGTAGCFDFAVDYLDWLNLRVGELGMDIWSLKMELRFLKTFILCGRKWKRNHVYLEREEESLCASLGCSSSIFLRIENMVCGNTRDLHSAYLCSSAEGDEVKKKLSSFEKNIKSFGSYIKVFYIILSDDHYSIGLGDARRLMDLIDSLLHNLEDVFFFYLVVDEPWYDLMKVLPEKLMFLKSFISFATTQAVERTQLIYLLIHVQVVTVNAARLIYVCCFDINDEQVHNRMECEISQLLHKIEPVDPQVRETYVRVLTDSMLSRSSSSSSDIFTLQNNGHSVASNIVSFILQRLWELLDCDTTGFMISVKDQMQILCGGINFLVALLTEQHEKFNKLHQRMKDLIGVVLVDTGIVIFSLSVNEMEKGLANETDNALFHLVRVLKFIMTEVAQICPLTSSSGFPRTNELGFIDFLQENVMELVTCEANSIALPKDQIRSVQEDVVFLKSFLEKIVEQRKQNEKLQDLWSRIMELAYRAEFVIDSLIIGDNSECLDTVARGIELIKIEALEIYDSMRRDTDGQRATNTSNRTPSQVSIPGLYEVLVGLDDEVNTIVDRLTRGSKHLDIVSIVGMPGLGKTTLANKVHHDPLIMCHFHIRAWCTISQVYSKHSLLLKILGDIVPGEYLKMNEDDLAEKLYKHLKGSRYLVVLDDVWDFEAWNLLKGSFPNDANGSRILFTSRFHNLCSQFKLDSQPHHLRPLTDEESWALLQNKIFGKGCCPPMLTVVGMQIAKSCKGLPLTVVIVAGILASIEQDSWEEIAKSLSYSTVIGTERCIETLELSYNHLPDYLKPCLLYFGAFQEDQDIPVRRIILLWISEGFVQKTKAKSLENVAEEYLMDLVGRSLVMVTQQRSLGGVKACQIHDLLHEFCVTKAKEESFLQILHGYNKSIDLLHEFCAGEAKEESFLQILHGYKESIVPLHGYNGPIVPCNPHRLCIYSTMAEFEKSRPFFPHLRCLLFFTGDGFHDPVKHGYPFIFRMFKLLRVLDLGMIFLCGFPGEVECLVHLRYLAIRCEMWSIPSSIAKLSWLETFVVRVFGGDFQLPNTIWNMKKLRHLCMEGIVYSASFSFPIDNLENSPDLYHLDTLTLTIDPDSSSQSLQMILPKLPSIRRLKCMGKAREPTGDGNKILLLDFLSRLESLHVVECYGFEFAFPLNLKKLTLVYNKQPWSEIQTIGKLPNLEVLKLLNEAFVGETWEIKEGEFPKLRFLKLERLDIVRWTASCDSFPHLQKLVLHGCRKLEEVPSCLGEIPTIDTIEVRWCHKSAISSVKQIQEEQMEMGNNCLRVIYQEY